MGASPLPWTGIFLLVVCVVKLVCMALFCSCCMGFLPAPFCGHSVGVWVWAVTDGCHAFELVGFSFIERGWSGGLLSLVPGGFMAGSAVWHWR